MTSTYFRPTMSAMTLNYVPINTPSMTSDYDSTETLTVTLYFTDTFKSRISLRTLFALA